MVCFVSVFCSIFLLYTQWYNRDTWGSYEFSGIGSPILIFTPNSTIGLVF